MHKEENLSFSGSAEQHAPAQELQNLTPRNRVTVGRRSFIRGLGIVGATLPPAGALLLRQAKAREQRQPIMLNANYNRFRDEYFSNITEG